MKLYQDEGGVIQLLEHYPGSSSYCIVPGKGGSPVGDLDIESMENDVKYALQFLECVEFLHSIDIVHLGLDPSCLKLQDGRVKLSGFQFSRHVTDHMAKWEKSEFQHVKSPSYIIGSFELSSLNSMPINPYHLDTYSACKVVLEMLSGDSCLFPRTLDDIRAANKAKPDLMYQKRRALKNLISHTSSKGHSVSRLLQEFHRLQANGMDSLLCELTT